MDLENASLQQIKWKDSGEIETKIFGLGEYVEGVNDALDAQIFFWVESIEELYKGADFGDFVII